MFSIPNYIKESGFDARNRKKVKICCPVYLVTSVIHEAPRCAVFSSPLLPLPPSSS